MRLTQIEKELLLRDICCRIPYETQVYCQNDNDWFDDEISCATISDLINEEYFPKPYLFPLSSLNYIAEKHKDEFDKITDYTLKDIQSDDISLDGFTEQIKLYNKYHIDYNNLIPKGLAIDATKLNIYNI